MSGCSVSHHLHEGEYEFRLMSRAGLGRGSGRGTRARSPMTRSASESTYRPSPLGMRGCCMHHQVIRCASSAVIDNPREPSVIARSDLVPFIDQIVSIYTTDPTRPGSCPEPYRIFSKCRGSARRSVSKCRVLAGSGTRRTPSGPAYAASSCSSPCAKSCSVSPCSVSVAADDIHPSDLVWHRKAAHH
jgi:hypothetical protein